jgi:murein DD-endopeptidase MepM/ murein hydrolase activator NlpD
MLRTTSKLFQLLTLFLLLISAAVFSPAVSAQEDQPQAPVYRVEEGDYLLGIALKFGVSIDDLAAANGISDYSQISVGTDLIIPGLPGVTGRLATIEIPIGENLASLSRQYRIPKEELARMNRLVSPMQAYRGKDLIVTENAASDMLSGRVSLLEGESLLEAAARSGDNPWMLGALNQEVQFWELTPGETLISATSTNTGPGALPTSIRTIALKPERITQGSTVVLDLQTDDTAQLNGFLGDWSLHFFQNGIEETALQGVLAVADPGFYPLSLQGTQADGTAFDFSQWVYIGDGGYPFDPPLTVNASLIDPAVTEPENEQVRAITERFSQEKLWQGQFVFPVAPVFSDCFTSRFGNRRSYNGSDYDFYHTGLDFCGAVGDDVYSTAAGEVVFTGPLTVRGNTTIIDHGWGVFTVYMHQSEIFVNKGDRVEKGQLIGYVGGTGRVEGPHLHWEVWAGGIPVDPINWLQNEYP